MEKEKDNQQQTPTEGEIGWLAGIIEGEGTISLSCWIRKQGTKPKIGTEIKIYNTDAGIIKKCADILERLDVGFHVSEREQKPMRTTEGSKYGGVDPMLAVSIKTLPEAYKLGKILQPYMFGDKASRLDLMLQYLARRLKRISDNGGNFRNCLLDYNDCKIVVDFYRKFVKKPGHNRKLVEGLLNDYK